MRKPQLCLALSASLALMQVSMQPALSEPAASSIWQKLAGASVSGSSQSRAKVAPVRRVAPNAVSVRGAVEGHAMLFLKGKESGGAAASVPAAALTIHPLLPEGVVSEVVSASEKPTLVAMNEVGGKQLLAQLAPDQIVAQSAGDAGATATPIPPVVTGTVDLEEFKASNVIDLKVSQSRTFKLRNKIVRTSISDPAIAEPVVVAENQLVLLGKAPGGATLVIWDDAGNSVAVDLKVSRDYSALQAMLREIDPRIIVKPFTVGGSDRVLLMGDVDHPESVLRAFAASNTFMDDRGMAIIAANSRLLAARIGEQGTGASSATGGQTGQLAQLSQVDKYVFFANTTSNVGKAQVMVSDGGRVTSLIKVRKVPLIVLHVTFMEVNTASVRELGVQLGINFDSQSFSFGIGGSNLAGTQANNGSPFFLTSLPGTNGVQGQSAFAQNSQEVFSGLIGGPYFQLVNGVQRQVVGFNPSQYQGRTATYGATSAPVSFTAANVIPQVVAGQLVNTPISAIGQGVFNGAPALLGQSVLYGASPGGAAFTAAGLPNMFTATTNFVPGRTSRWSMNPSIQGIISHSRARVLAEPTLVTISGERAAFLAGGEIPIVQQLATAGGSLPSVSYEPFGLRLNIIPVLLENGTINLQVAPEERIISNANGTTFTGGQGFVPGFTTRKTQTIVEMKPGQELFISGLVSANSGRELTKTPLLGEVPVLGALYRSKAFAKNESELVIAVRPEVILPGNPGQLRLPEEISRVEGPRDTNLFQVEPTVVDERYMTSGRSERTQKVPGVLPAGSPIPDNQ